MKDTPETTLILKRTFKAPVEAVYAAWTEPEQFGQWMGPAVDMVCAVEAHDVRVGRRYAFEITNADGQVHGASGHFRDVVENARLVFTWTWNHMPDTETLVTVEFRGTDEATTMILTHERHASAESTDNHRGGWTGAFDKLERLLAGKSDGRAG